MEVSLGESQKSQAALRQPDRVLALRTAQNGSARLFLCKLDWEAD